jgi:hypothetical protein
MEDTADMSVRSQGANLKPSRFLSVLGLACSVAGCVGMTQMQHTASEFDKAVHSTATTELVLFREVQAGECNDQFYLQAYRVAGLGTDRLDPSQIDLIGGHCTHQELTDGELAIRQKLLSTLTLYADTIQALSEGKGNLDPSAKEKALAGDIKSLATQGKFSSAEKSGAAGLDAAVSAVVHVIIDRRVYKDVGSAAGAVQSELTVVIGELQAENRDDAQGLRSKYGSVNNEMVSALKLACERGGAECFFGIASAHTALNSVIVAPPDVEQLNKTLDAVLAANASLAQPKSTGAVVEVSELADRAQQAATLFSASK